MLANVFRPAAGGPFPVLLTRTPYGKDFAPTMLGVDPLRAVEHDYIVVSCTSSRTARTPSRRQRWRNREY